MLKTIIYFIGVYDTLDLFTEELKKAFENMGYGSFVYDAGVQQQSKQTLLELLSSRAEVQSGETESQPDLSDSFAVVTFNNLGYNLDLPDGRNLWETYGIPYLNILMDHPFHYEKPLRNAPETSIVLCTDRNHVKYIRRFLKNIRQTDFLPHAGVELWCKHKPLQERGIDVLYAGALPIYTVAKMIPDFTSIPEVDGEALAQNVLDELVHHPEKTTEVAIEEYLRSIRNDISEQRIQQIIVKMRFLDSYATSFFREQAVRLLVESGIRVTAYGTGWDQCEWSDNPYLDYRGKVLAPQILPLMNDSKIVLNTMTWFKAGAHDRIFNGMLARSAVVTDDSTYLRREFTDGKELVMFSLKELGTLPERVFELFGHMESTQEMADCGYQAAKANHMWKSRAEYLVECYL
ncbi:MAG: glycosyltransferase [Clostridiales bacterium]|nr:glycosyltransferase [Clostridiales bacterium]